ncbi:MAG: MBL fold metallo-hydrolase [Luteitalea sp.]|nr:MBL fold metallo-hydrolase [Luteitalea sp.]
MWQHVLSRRQTHFAAIGAGVLIAAACAVTTVVEAAAGPQTLTVPSVRLYVLDCGLLKRGEPKNYQLTTEEVGGVTDFFNACYLVVHPKGTLLWDTGIVLDALVRPGGVEIPGNNFASKTLRSQLGEAGYAAADITYLAMSHSHADHIANANDYAGSTWLIQRAEHATLFGGRPQAPGQAPSRIGPEANYIALKDAKTVLLDGDHDLFGDGVVVIKSTPGHTPGHQSLFVKLAQTGPVLLSGDLYHYAAERTLKKIPVNDNQEQTQASRDTIDALLEQTGGQLWIQHDFVASTRQKRSPAYYE